MSVRASSIVLRQNKLVPGISRANRVYTRYAGRRLLSSEEPSAVKPSTRTASANLEAIGESSATSIVRRGPDDKVMCLDVGGKHFYTLKSTIAANPVLADIVARAEAYGDLTSNGNAVFVDRDPRHFQVILTYLRNTSEGLSYNDKTGIKTRINKVQRVQLPKDSEALSDLYLEASYFQIEPLKDALCHHSIFTWIASAFSGRQNPFNLVSDAVRTLRRGALALAGVGGTMSLGTLKVQLFPWSNGKNEGEEESESLPG
mmetsp:Transcript_5914/g.10806  ORF Transcript_5914/g.10806 Transcript_5914/m.10806 type:complete len:259 (-) Transcript_5914:52-828(-)